MSGRMQAFTYEEGPIVYRPEDRSYTPPPAPTPHQAEYVDLGELPQSTSRDGITLTLPRTPWERNKENNMNHWNTR